MNTIPEALARARAGDIPGAIAAGEADLAQGTGNAGLAMFVGTLCCRQGELERGIAHLRHAVSLAPDQAPPRMELGRALLAAGDATGAGEAVAGFEDIATPPGREMQRIGAHAALRQGRAEEAARLFGELTAADPGDYESWDGRGASTLILGEVNDAVEAGRRATGLRPSAIAYWTNLARALVLAKDWAAAIEAAGNAIMRDPNDAPSRLELGRALSGERRHDEAAVSLAHAEALAGDRAELLTEIAEAQGNARDHARAEASFRRALLLRPGHEAAILGLAKVLERLNRNAEVLALLDAHPEVPAERAALLRARALRGETRLEEAQAALAQVPAEIEPAARAQLAGEIADRLGDTDTAFAAFSEAKARLAAEAEDAAGEAAAYRERFEAMRGIVTPEWRAGWTPQPESADGRRSPLFIFGFPRSGTTLIDTMLGGHPDALVMEEEPVLDRLAVTVGGIERLAGMTPAEIAELRRFYWAEANRFAPELGQRLLIDKHPLGLGGTPALHRLFPDARFVFVERHPLDVVLSCFITSSVMNASIASFYDFAGTARLYDAVLGYWHQVREALPIAVHTVRYETLIAAPEAELRRLAEFAGLEWNERLLANETNAAERSFIASPSYTQVAQPIYTRASGRWKRYRRHMEPVIPILQPWIDRLGYSLD